MIDNILKYINRDCSHTESRKESAFFSLLFILLAHAVIYLTPIYGHDNIVVAINRVHQSATGTRWLQDWFLEPVGFINSSWFNGIICSIILIIVTVQIIDVLEIRKRVLVFFAAGIIITNPTVINSNLYGWPFLFFFANLFMTSAVWILVRKDEGKKHLAYDCLAVLFVCFGCATYGGYIGVFPTLYSLKIVVDIMKGTDIRKSFISTIRGIIVFVFGVALYYVIERFALSIKGITAIEEYGTRNSVTHYIGINQYLYGVGRAYIDFVNYLLGRTHRFGYVPSLLSILCILVGIISFCYYCYEKKVKKQSLVFLFIIAILEPMLVNLIYVAAAGFAHTLMLFTFAIVYVFCIKLFEMGFCNTDICAKKKNILCSAGMIVFALFVYYGTFLSNVAYTRAENMYTRTLSICTRLLDRIEMNYTGNEDVVLIGTIDMYSDYFNSTESESLNILYGMTYIDPYYNNSFAFGGKEITYLTNIMGSGLKYTQYSNVVEAVDEMQNISDEEKKAIKQMQPFPQKDSVIKMGDHIMVLLSNRE